MVGLALYILLFIVGYMCSWFVLSLLLKRNDIADVAWGLGFIFVAVTLGIQTGNWQGQPLVVTGLTTVWGLRLAWHIFGRNRNRKEDFRYQQWRKEWGKWWVIRSLVQVWLLQGLFMWLISMSAIAVFVSAPTEMGWSTVLGVLVWLIGFYFEAVGDWQLSNHVKNPQNKGVLMTTGLWRYTRHPNYFGEVAQWWGMWLITVGSTYSALALISPLTISWLILKVSGIPMLEKKYQGRADFEAYAKATSAFFPWFPAQARKSFEQGR